MYVCITAFHWDFLSDKKTRQKRSVHLIGSLLIGSMLEDHTINTEKKDTSSSDQGFFRCALNYIQFIWRPYFYIVDFALTRVVMQGETLCEQVPYWIGRTHRSIPTNFLLLSSTRLKERSLALLKANARPPSEVTKARALCYVCLVGFKNIVGLLLDAGADTQTIYVQSVFQRLNDIEAESSFNCLDCAIIANHPETVRVLLNRFSDMIDHPPGKTRIVDLSALEIVSNVLDDISKQELKQALILE